MFGDQEGVGGDGTELAGGADPVAAEVAIIGTEIFLFGDGIFEVGEAGGVDVEDSFAIAVVADGGDDGVDRLGRAFFEDDLAGFEMIDVAADGNMALANVFDGTDVEDGWAALAAELFEWAVGFIF